MYDVLVPLNLIFVNRSKKDLTDLAGLDIPLKDSDVVPLITSPVMKMVNRIISGKGDIESYYQDCIDSGLYKSSVSKNDFLKEFRKRITSLRWNPFKPKPVISTMDNDCLILEDGIELCCVYKAIGKSWIKVSMAEDAYTKWLARKTDVLDDVVKRTSRKMFYSPIAHPKYRKASVARRDSIRLDRIRKLLGPIGNGLIGLDIGSNMGYMSHHLQRQGFRMTAIDYNENHLAVARALNEAYGLDVKFKSCYFKQLKND